MFGHPDNNAINQGWRDYFNNIHVNPYDRKRERRLWELGQKEASESGIQGAAVKCVNVGTS